jgi:hypothetical protein
MCKCQEQTDFKVALRKALSESTDKIQLVVWENKESKIIYVGAVEEAENRLKNGKIECYFIPKKGDEKVTFKIVDKPIAIVEKVEPILQKPKVTDKSKPVSENKK